jgi:hypothetical protein
MLKKWLPAIKHLAEHGKLGNCPYCNSANTHFGYVPFDRNPSYGWGTLWCGDCKHALWISRLFITPETDLGEPIPDDLIFK